MLQAEADLIVFADADVATPPDQLPALISVLRSHDVALGSRIQADRSDMRAPASTSRRVSAPPTKPAPPVTRMRRPPNDRSGVLIIA